MHECVQHFILLVCELLCGCVGAECKLVGGPVLLSLSRILLILTVFDPLEADYITVFGETIKVSIKCVALIS